MVEIIGANRLCTCTGTYKFLGIDVDECIGCSTFITARRECGTSTPVDLSCNLVVDTLIATCFLDAYKLEDIEDHAPGCSSEQGGSSSQGNRARQRGRRIEIAVDCRG